MSTIRVNQRNGTVRGSRGLFGRCLGPWVLGILLAVFASKLLAGPTITDIEFSSRPGSKFEIRLDFDEPPPEMKDYTIESPARIAIDFTDTSSSLERKSYSLPYGNATGVIVLESGERTRMVVNLVKLVPYETRVDGNSLYLIVGQEGATS
ncbi:MAG: AMIN domain-containing protein, partial [Halieaceae bacterium]|nr:AMIN domain-containing protein [Halieaceae bacterium]